MLKKIALSAALALALSPALAPLPALASNLPDYPFVHTGGDAFAFIMPDIGEIDFDVSAYDADPAVALALVEARIAEIRALLAEQGAGQATPQGEPVVEANMRDIRKEMRKGDHPDPANGPAYDIRCSVHIIVRDLGKWRAVVQPLLGKPNIDHMSTSFGLRERDKAERDLMTAAVKDAERKGETMAAGLGKHIGAVTAMSNGPLRNLTLAIGLAPSDTYRTPRGVNVSVEKDFLSIQALRFTQTVDVIFRIK